MTLKYKCSTWPTEVLQAHEPVFVGVWNGYLSPFRACKLDFFSSCLICRTGWISKVAFRVVLLDRSWNRCSFLPCSTVTTYLMSGRTGFNFVLSFPRTLMLSPIYAVFTMKEYSLSFWSCSPLHLTIQCKQACLLHVSTVYCFDKPWCRKKA